jgi:hypothetical protein
MKDKNELKIRYKNGLDFLEDSLKNSKRYTRQIKKELLNKDEIIEQLCNMSIIFNNLYKIIMDDKYSENEKIKMMSNLEIDGEKIMDKNEAKYLYDLIMLRMDNDEIKNMKKYIREKYSDIISPRKQKGGQEETPEDKTTVDEPSGDKPSVDAEPSVPESSIESSIQSASETDDEPADKEPTEPVDDKLTEPADVDDEPVAVDAEPSVEPVAVDAEPSVPESSGDKPSVDELPPSYEEAIKPVETKNVETEDVESEGEKKIFPVSSSEFKKTESMINPSLSKSNVPKMLSNAIYKIFPKPEKEIYDSNNKPLELTDDVKNYCLLNISSLIPKLILGAPKYIFNFLSDLAHGVAKFFNFSFDNFEDFSKPLDFTFYLLFALASIPSVGAIFDIIIILRALSHRRLFLAILTGLTFIASLILTGHIFDLGALLKLFYALEVNNSMQTQNYVDDIAKNNLQIIANSSNN